MSKSERLDTILMRRGWVSDGQVFQALMEQERLRQPFGSTLVAMGFITERQLAVALAEQFDTPEWDPETAVVERAALDLFPEEFVREKLFLPLAYDEDVSQLEIAIADPTNDDVLAEIRAKGQVETLVVATAPTISLQRLWKRFYQKQTPPLTASGNIPPATASGRVPQMTASGRIPQMSASGRIPQSLMKGPQRLGLEFSFSVERPETLLAEENPAAARVLLWLSQPFVAKLLKSLLEIERCEVANWDGTTIPPGKWQYLVYDHDSYAASPEALTALKRQQPQIQVVLRPSLTTAVLRSPLSYERLRDGYIHLSEYVRHLLPQKQRDQRVARYTLAVARLLPLSEYEIDTLMVACELTPLFQENDGTMPTWESVAESLRCPFPAIDILRTAPIPFDQCGAKPGQSSADSPLGARVLSLVTAFLLAAEHTTPKSIDDLSALTDWMRDESGKRFDPLVVESLLRVLREEVLDGCLPPGPAEVILVADRPIEWTHLSMQLENDGWRVVTANGAAEARKLVERRCPDAVVWAASGAIEWIHWLQGISHDVANFLLLEEQNQPLARAALEAGYEDVWTGAWDAGVAVTKLRKAVVRRPEGAAARGTVAGDLAQLSFIDLVQILTAGTRSVAIELEQGSRKARVVLWRGQIKYAETGKLTGAEAVYEILAWEQGSFELSPVEEMPPVNCRIPNDALLLEGCRLLDEKKRANSA